MYEEYFIKMLIEFLIEQYYMDDNPFQDPYTIVLVALIRNKFFFYDDLGKYYMYFDPWNTICRKVHEWVGEAIVIDHRASLE